MKLSWFNFVKYKHCNNECNQRDSNLTQRPTMIIVIVEPNVLYWFCICPKTCWFCVTIAQPSRRRYPKNSDAAFFWWKWQQSKVLCIFFARSAVPSGKLMSNTISTILTVDKDVHRYPRDLCHRLKQYHRLDMTTTDDNIEVAFLVLLWYGGHRKEQPIMKKAENHNSAANVFKNWETETGVFAEEHQINLNIFSCFLKKKAASLNRL